VRALSPVRLQRLLSGSPQVGKSSFPPSPARLIVLFLWTSRVPRHHHHRARPDVASGLSCSVLISFLVGVVERPCSHTPGPHAFSFHFRWRVGGLFRSPLSLPFPTLPRTAPHPPGPQLGVEHRSSTLSSPILLLLCTVMFWSFTCFSYPLCSGCDPASGPFPIWCIYACARGGCGSKFH